ncbi:Hypothetical predicted protein [Octopus vulgaris]|uniref:Uncharacterized protein n=1 Tax=Octopus vulgaris TaxID=6645 RepID=A0AA36B8P8_OCTVU|nr:Hypothetical predicted protein [Octopus vulgaris]
MTRQLPPGKKFFSPLLKLIASLRWFMAVTLLQRVAQFMYAHISARAHVPTCICLHVLLAKQSERPISRAKSPAPKRLRPIASFH